MGLTWEAIGDDVFVPRRGRGGVGVKDGVSKKKRKTEEEDVFNPRRVPRGGSLPDTDADVEVIRRRTRAPQQLLLNQGHTLSPHWDGVWDVAAAAAAAAAVEVISGMNSDPTEILAAHLASGWTLRPRGDAGTGKSKRCVDAVKSKGELTVESLELCPPEHASISVRENLFTETKTDSLSVLRDAYGLVPCTVSKKHDNSDNNSAITQLAAAVCRVSGAVSCARLVGTHCRSRRWCRAALGEATAATVEVEKVVKKSQRALGSTAYRAVCDLTQRIRTSLRNASKAMDEDEELRREFSFRSETYGGNETKSDDGPMAIAMRAMSGGGDDLPGVRTHTEDDTNQGSSSDIITHWSIIHLACALDETWFALAYHERCCGWTELFDESKTKTRTKNDFCAMYFTVIENASYAQTVQKMADAVNKANESPNPLLTVLHCKLKEGARLFHSAALEEEDLIDSDVFSPENGVQETAVVAAVAKRAHLNSGKHKKKKQKSEVQSLPPSPACPPLTLKWRDMTRHWPCRLYAFAAPTDSALDLLKKHSKKWLEVGAGAGYWAQLMSKHGMDIVAVDVDPPGPDTYNDYHGKCATWHDVLKGDASRAYFAGILISDTKKEKVQAEEDVYRNRSIFMCYPPPGFENEMATETLEQYVRGAEEEDEQSRAPLTVAVVGEWDGNTADGLFAEKLHAFFYLADRVPLPQWGDTAHELTVWQLRGKNDSIPNKSELPLKQCGWCSKSETALRRCTLCRDNCGTFCSRKCCVLGVDNHAANHELRLIPTLKETLTSFESNVVYKEFKPFGG